ECLLLQLRELEPGSSLATAIVRDFLPALEKKQYRVIAAALAVSEEEVVRAARTIARLKPKPGRRFTNAPTRYITPDVLVVKLADEYAVEVNGSGLPRLRVSSVYRHLLDGASTPETKAFMNSNLSRA